MIRKPLVINNGRKATLPAGDKIAATDVDISGYDGAPVVTQADVGTEPNQIPLNQYLGSLAYQDREAVDIGALSVDTINGLAPHEAVTVADSTSIDLTLTGQQISAAAIFGTTSTTVAAGNHLHTGVYEPVDATIIRQADVDDTPVNGVTTAPISSNWAFDHAASTTAHGLDGTPVVVQADIGTEPNQLPLNQYLGSLAYQDNPAVSVLSLNTSGDLIINPAAKLNIEGATAYNVGKAVNFEMGDGIIGWRDLIADIVLRGNASTDPVWSQIGSTAFWGYKSAIGKRAYITFHINHDYYPGGQILLHTHWVSGGTNTTNSVKWQFSYVVAKGHNQSSGGTFAFASPTVVTVETVPGGQYRHMISEIASSIVVTNAEVDSLIMVVVERITNGGTDNSDDIFLTTVDCHYQASRFATPQKSPNFYS